MRISETDSASASGYTLTELLVVLVILSIALGGSVMFTLGRSGTASLPRLSSQVASLISSASTRSILTQREVLVVIDPVSNEISTTGEDLIHIPDGVAIEVITAKSELLEMGHAAIRFFPEGGSTGGSIRLSADENVFSIEIDWLTGRVSIVEGQEAPGE